MNSFGERLREERQRLGLNQTEFAALADVQKQAQLKYEKGDRSPDANYLAAIAVAGADVQYIVTGVRRGDGVGLGAAQQAVLKAVDLLDRKSVV